MTKANNPNLEILRQALHCLEEMADQFAFVEAVPGHMPTDEASRQRVPRILNILRTISQLDE